MHKIILVCGKTCSGKTTYTKNLIQEIKAVHLSVDEISLAIFGGQIGESHAEIIEKIASYLFEKSIELHNIGLNVVIDTGFWQKADRDNANDFYKKHNITPQWHYIDVSDDLWQQRIDKRNYAVKNGETMDYLIDDNTLDFFLNLWEAPNKEEIDIWVSN